jgi:prevent-host-death family protein
MFEIHDERIGHLKIFNVTEARANFADVLKESNAKVVVTRHGRPTKILISYEEYLELLAASGRHDGQGLGSSDVTASITGEVQVGSEEDSANKPLPPKWVQREADQIVNSLRGLLGK